MILLVIFDMAGTAINEDNLVYKTILTTLRDYEIQTDLKTVLEHCAGKEKKAAIRDVIVEISKENPPETLVEEMHSAFKKKLSIIYETAEMEVFPSVKKVIESLKRRDIKVSFNTGYTREVAEQILKNVDIEVGKDIDVLMTASDVSNSRPAPDMINEICNRLDIPANLVIKIGDSAVDIQEGKNAKVKYSIGITTGAQNRTQMQKANPDFIIDDMLQLLPIIGGN
ncbi:MAG: phosphonatase-like hydrolase [Saprospiraceae bacterium]|jgi:phosphonatase-like hydrolase